jgi:hypothetical protein
VPQEQLLRVPQGHNQAKFKAQYGSQSAFGIICTKFQYTC